MRRLLLPLALATLAALAAPLGAQRLSLRVDNVETDTAYLAAGDAVPVRVLGKTVSGGTTTPTFVSWAPPHCIELRAANPPTAAILTQRDCGPVPGWLVAEATVSGARVRDSVWVTPPRFALGAPRGLCLTWNPAAQFYSARDTVIALAIRGADRLIAATFVPDSVAPSYQWQGATLTYEMAAIACMPGYRATDITRARGVQWASADTSAATVSRGVVTVKRRGPVVVAVDWSP